MSQPKLTELSRTNNQLDAKPEQIETVSPQPLKQEQALLREIICVNSPPITEKLSFRISNNKARERE